MRKTIIVKDNKIKLDKLRKLERYFYAKGIQIEFVILINKK